MALFVDINIASRCRWLAPRCRSHRRFCATEDSTPRMPAHRAAGVPPAVERRASPGGPDVRILCGFENLSGWSGRQDAVLYGRRGRLPLRHFATRSCALPIANPRAGTGVPSPDYSRCKPPGAPVRRRPESNGQTDSACQNVSPLRCRILLASLLVRLPTMKYTTERVAGCGHTTTRGSA
jgi:hypothetical protein